MADHKPTILLIPGAWHKGLTFEPVATILRDQGYEAETITLPSAGGPASTTAYDDAEHIQRQYLEPLISSKRNVILLMHSYAGVPGTESVKGFARKDLAAQGKKGGVCWSRLSLFVYSSSWSERCDAVTWWTRQFHDNRGVYFINFPELLLPALIRIQDDMMIPKSPRETFYNYLDDAAAEKYLADIVPHAPAAMSTPLTYEAYREVDTSYIFCTKDTGFPLVGQQRIAAIAGEDRVYSYSVDAGHFAMLSRSGDVAKALMNVANRVAQDELDKL